MADSRRETLAKELKESMGEVTWADLRRHLARDVIIVVAPDLEILEAAIKIAENDQDQVDSWIKKGLLDKPGASQIEYWEKHLKLPFLMVVVQPFILIQIKAADGQGVN